MNKPVSFPPHVLARAARAAYLYGLAERAYEVVRSYEAAKDLLDAWTTLRDLQEKLDFFFHGRPNEEPPIVVQARRTFSRGPRGEGRP